MSAKEAIAMEARVKASPNRGGARCPCFGLGLGEHAGRAIFPIESRAGGIFLLILNIIESRLQIQDNGGPSRLLRRLLALSLLLAIAGGAFVLWKGGATAGLKLGDLRSAGEGLADAKVSASVKAALSLNRTLAPLRIRVSTERRVVTLRGDVPDDTLKAAAGRVAAAVPDVAQVVNHLAVSPAMIPAATSDRTLGESLDDRALEVQVRLALALHRGLESSDIRVDAYRRHVTLSGRVDRPEQERDAIAIARETAGVLDVTDRIEAATSDASSPPGTDPRAAAERALRANKNLAAYALEVRDEGGRLVLRGRVRTGAEKDLAEALAREAARKPVENGLEVQL
jgi:osmotically-inducible protein OsmY